MLVDLVNVTTDDGLRLDGALHAPPPDVPTSLGVDAVLCLHGTGSNFYASNMMASLVAAMRDRGAAALAANTRGHDGISTTSAPLGRRLQGAAYEIVDACRHDVAAWLAMLRNRGHKRLGLLGHSLGAVKALYAQAHQTDRDVAWIVAISPPRLSHAEFAAGSHGETFRRDYAQAEAMVREGRAEALMEIRYPLPYAVSAAGFLDKYGTDERYNVLGFVGRIACPLVITYGTAELPTSVAFRGMPEAFEEHARGRADRHVALVAGADHFYAGMYHELWARVEDGLRRLSILK
ncbi:MAG: alpha/beta fold hydrolase [Planctomycetia bacterium]|nr:alpha/beta fold hydrolase [Planctomycetia bacterium]